ncbi:AraC family transcriptional regulator [Klebsiella sp. RIT-PI-d]|uniref:AraC family transcriptional regulator n=1 Tax=Klebsiella sp. RIT-PI-d TaxID=1681196 RepID=UPI000675BCC8|nr:AraC family transcriptional regulator [Klebsiella sp. RIT-PI-d]KNC09580.1 AraC family transcriptional regulator [Klebsiella sp. RIT-PI-d]
MMQNPLFLTQTPEMKPQAPFALSSALISELLTGMRLRGVQYRRVVTGSEFGLNFPAKAGRAYFHFLASGTALLRLHDGQLHRLDAGNAVFMPKGTQHQLVSHSAAAVHCLESLDAAPIGETVYAVKTCQKASPASGAVFFYGCMEFNLGGMQGLEPLMPDMMLVDIHSGRYPGLVPVLGSMQQEMCSSRVGFAGILARLADVVAAMIVRGWVECGCDNESGLVAALRDPRLARAILALHREPGRSWTVSELAAECHISRSVFADRFQATIGTSPLRYVTELRMHLASQWLAEHRLPIETVAQRLGYTSQAAFSRAFKRVTGQAPGARRLKQASL